MFADSLHNILRQIRRKSVIFLGVAACVMNSLAAHAVDAVHAQLLSRRNACISCHTADQKRIGPAYRDVAARYRDQPDALAKLVEKIKKGGAGAWGAVPMPAHPRLSEVDAQTIVVWVLADAPSE